jgi:hypothetical protein
VKALPSARRRRQIPQRPDGDPLARVRDRELVDLVGQLDETYDYVLAQALAGGGDGIYQLAANVRAAADYLINLRLSAAR